MRKRILPTTKDAETAAGDWLDLEALVEVEITSEDPGHPIEAALVPGDGPGWRAATPGAQTIRLNFDPPQTVSRIRLEFKEASFERTQEFVLRWSADGKDFRDVVRQQWNFSPGGADQVEDYTVDLAGVAVLELEITPDISGGSAPASLERLQLA